MSWTSPGRSSDPSAERSQRALVADPDHSTGRRHAPGVGDPGRDLVDVGHRGGVEHEDAVRVRRHIGAVAVDRDALVVARSARPVDATAGVDARHEGCVDRVGMVGYPLDRRVADHLVAGGLRRRGQRQRRGGAGARGVGEIDGVEPRAEVRADQRGASGQGDVLDLAELRADARLFEPVGPGTAPGRAGFALGFGLRFRLGFGLGFGLALATQPVSAAPTRGRRPSSNHGPMQRPSRHDNSPSGSTAERTGSFAQGPHSGHAAPTRRADTRVSTPP